MNAAFTFPEPTGVAQHDGLALLRHVMAHGTTPVDLERCRLALHAAALAYQGQPTGTTVLAVNRAVDALAAAVRRLKVDEAAAQRTAQLAKLQALLDEPASDDGGALVPVAPVPPAPPFSAGETPTADKLEALAKQLAEKTGLTLPQARQLIIDKVRAAGAAKEAA